MFRIARSFTRVAVTVAVLGSALAMTVMPAAAQSDAAPKGIWLAGFEAPSSPGTHVGRLELRDGVLSFNATATGWQLALSDLRRASMGPSDQLVLEGASGEIHRLTILDARMVADSPRDALKIIQRALRAPAARRE